MENPSYDKIVIDDNRLSCYIIYKSYRGASVVSRKYLVNRNNFRSFYEQIVKNALKTKKMP